MDGRWRVPSRQRVAWRWQTKNVCLRQNVWSRCAIGVGWSTSFEEEWSRKRAGAEFVGVSGARCTSICWQCATKTFGLQSSRVHSGDERWSLTSCSSGRNRKRSNRRGSGRCRRTEQGRLKKKESRIGIFMVLCGGGVGAPRSRCSSRGGQTVET